MDAMEPGHTDNEELSLLRPTSIVVDAPPEPPAADTVVIEPTKRKLPSLNASISMSSLSQVVAVVRVERRSSVWTSSPAT